MANPAAGLREGTEPSKGLEEPQAATREPDEECISRVVPQPRSDGGADETHATAPLTRPLTDAFMELFGLPTMSQARRAVRTGQVFVEGVKRKGSFSVSAGERIEWRQRTEGAPTLDRSLVPRDLQASFRVVYEDDDIAVVWKPADLETNAGGGGTWSAVRLAHHYLKPGTARGSYCRARAVHRLDAPTSGLVCLAKTQPAHMKLSEAFRERGVHKTYLALLVGPPLEKRAGRIDSPLKCLETGKGAVMQDAVTEYEMLRYTPAPVDLGGGLLTVRFRPLTGRTHQLRRHAAQDLGRPILGDAKYGGSFGSEVTSDTADIADGRLFLCAVGLDLPAFGGRTCSAASGAAESRLRLNVDEPVEFEAQRKAAEAAAHVAEQGRVGDQG